MPKAIQTAFKDMPAYRVIGRLRKGSLSRDNKFYELWGKCFGDGDFARLEAIEGVWLDPSYVGWMGDFDGDAFSYIAGMLAKAGTPVPEGFDSRDVPASYVGVAWIQGREDGGLYPEAHRLSEEALRQAGGRPDPGMTWAMELYNCPRFTTPGADGEVILDYYIPCVPGRGS